MTDDTADSDPHNLRDTAPAAGPSALVTGAVRSYRNTDEPLHVYGASYYPDERSFLLCLAREGGRLWRRGRKTRIERLDGTPVFATDGQLAWGFLQDPARPWQWPLRMVQFFGPGRALVLPPTKPRRATGAAPAPADPPRETTFLGRACWEVTVTADPGRSRRPARKLLVDQETGAALAEHDADGASGAAFEDVRILPDSTDEERLFSWDGPVWTYEDELERARSIMETRTARRTRWFADNITPGEMRIPVLTDFPLAEVRDLDEDTGAFTAALGHGEAPPMLRRRPRSDQPWQLPPHGNLHAWSTEGFDWSVVLYRGTFEPDALARLQHLLHPAQPPVGHPPITLTGPKRHP